MITINMNKAREITHDRRRAKRTEEFKPLDIEVTIPALAEEAEAKRQAIRDRYAVMQEQIDVATSADELKTIIEENEL